MNTCRRFIGPYSIVTVGVFLLYSVGVKSAAGSVQSSSFWSRLKRKIQLKPMYDREENKRNAVPVLNLVGSELSWFRLDDGVMGGKSESHHKSLEGILSFEGFINTDGGGFTSIRSELPADTLDTNSKALKIKLKGDGKTYKVFLTNGIPSAGPRSSSPSWQADIPTTGKWQEVTIPFDSLQPSFGGPSRRRNDVGEMKFDSTEMRQLGLMLSLRLSNGDDNPKETFGEGIFPFSLQVKSIQVVNDDKVCNK